MVRVQGRLYPKMPFCSNRVQGEGTSCTLDKMQKNQLHSVRGYKKGYKYGGEKLGEGTKGTHSL